MNTPLYVREAHIKSLVRQSEKEVFHRVFGKLTIVVLKLPNGFTVIGHLYRWPFIMGKKPTKPTK